MNAARLLILLSLAGALLTAEEPPSLALPEETHLRNVRQLTFGGENAEAYFSADDRLLILQSSGEGVPCDQIYILPLEPGPDGQPREKRLVSTGKGKTTCSYFFPSGERILIFLHPPGRPRLSAASRLLSRLRVAYLCRL